MTNIKERDINLTDSPAWIANQPEFVEIKKHLGLGGCDPVFEGSVHLGDEEEIPVAVKLTGRLPDENREPKALREPKILEKIRTIYTTDYPGQPVPVLFARAFNHPDDTRVPKTTLIDSLPDRRLLTPGRDWYKSFEEKEFPQIQALVVMELLGPEYEQIYSLFSKPSSKTVKAYFSCLQQYFQLLTALHQNGLTSNDRKIGGDARFNPETNKLVVLDWDTAKNDQEYDFSSPRQRRLKDFNIALIFFAGSAFYNKDLSDFPQLEETKRVLRQIKEEILFVDSITAEKTTTGITLQRKIGSADASKYLRVVQSLVAGKKGADLQVEIDDLIEIQTTEITNNEPVNLDLFSPMTILQHFNDEQKKAITDVVYDFFTHVKMGATISAVESLGKIQVSMNEDSDKIIAFAKILPVIKRDTLIDAYTKSCLGNKTFSSLLDSFSDDLLLIALRPDCVTQENYQRAYSALEQLKPYLTSPQYKAVVALGNLLTIK